MLAASIYRKLQKISKIILSFDANNLIPGSSSNVKRCIYLGIISMAWSMTNAQLLFIFLFLELDNKKENARFFVLLPLQRVFTAPDFLTQS